MTDQTVPSVKRPLQLSFNARISFDKGEEKKGLLDGVRLFQRAEELGYQTGWVYQRHFDNYLSSPITFLTAVAQHTEVIGLGSAIIPIRNEDPLLLAEAAGTADVLSNGRLELGIGKGMDGYDHLFGDRAEGHVRQRATQKLDEFLAGIRGEVVGRLSGDELALQKGAELRVTPHSASLNERTWYGAASIQTTQMTVERGLNLLLGTVARTGESGLSYDAYQRSQAELYLQGVAVEHPNKRPQVGVQRSVLPSTDPDRARRYERYDLDRQRFGPAASRPKGALPPAAPQGSSGFTLAPVLRGDPDQVIEEIAADAALQVADELILFLPPEFGLEENTRLLTDVAQFVAPSLSGPSASRTGALADA